MLALVQTDIKRLIAYSSISHLGFCMLGIISFTPQGFMGGVLQVFNHGISTGALFLLAGMLYERAHTKGVHDFGGLAHHAPRYTVFFALATLSSIGLPGLNNFIGEFLCLLGAFNVYPILASIGACGVILAAGYMLLLFKRLFYGEKKEYHFGDLGRREIALLLPLIIMIFWVGVYPKPFLAQLEPTNKELLKPILEVMDTEEYSVRR
jgi:NADH-quinone oxidoreductase subunit M